MLCKSLDPFRKGAWNQASKPLVDRGLWIRWIAILSSFAWPGMMLEPMIRQRLPLVTCFGFSENFHPAATMRVWLRHIFFGNVYWNQHVAPEIMVPNIPWNGWYTIPPRSKSRVHEVNVEVLMAPSVSAQRLVWELTMDSWLPAIRTKSIRGDCWQVTFLYVFVHPTKGHPPFSFLLLRSIFWLILITVWEE